MNDGKNARLTVDGFIEKADACFGSWEARNAERDAAVNVALLAGPGDYASVLRRAAADDEHEHIVVLTVRSMEHGLPPGDWLPFERCCRYGWSALSARGEPGYGRRPSLLRHVERLERVEAKLRGEGRGHE